MRYRSGKRATRDETTAAQEEEERARSNRKAASSRRRTADLLSLCLFHFLTSLIVRLERERETERDKATREIAVIVEVGRGDDRAAFSDAPSTGEGGGGGGGGGGSADGGRPIGCGLSRLLFGALSRKGKTRDVGERRRPFDWQTSEPNPARERQRYNQRSARSSCFPISWPSRGRQQRSSPFSSFFFFNCESIESLKARAASASVLGERSAARNDRCAFPESDSGVDATGCFRFRSKRRTRNVRQIERPI